MLQRMGFEDEKFASSTGTMRGLEAKSGVDLERAEIGVPVPKWEDKGVTFALAGPLKRAPAAKPRVMFFPHLATGHKGILNAMANDQGVPLKMTFPGAGASSVTLVL